MTSLRTQQARARRGIAFLDQKLGRGWRRKIKRTELDMESCSACILGQLYGRYDKGLNALNLSWGGMRLSASVEIRAPRFGFRN